MPPPPIEPPVAPPIDCQCLMEYPVGAIPGDVVATIQGGSYVYPSEYGLGRCDAHDATLAPYCDTVGPDGAFDPLSNPAWCSATWCFIDPSGCNVAYDDSTHFPGSGLYYSYDACESSNQFNDFYLAIMPRSAPQPAPPAAPAPPRPPPVPSPPPTHPLVAEAGAGADAVGAGVAAAIVVSLMLACIGLACRRRELELRMELAKKEMELGHQLQLSRATDEEKEAIRTELQQSDSGATSAMLRRVHIPLDELSLEGRLGAGSFGTVVQATWRGTPVAVKRLHRHRIHAEALRQFKAAREAECELLLSLRHPNIVQLIGGCWCANDATVCMVLEYCAGGSLSKALADTQARLTWTHHRLPIALGVARAMAYLYGQEPPVLHRDLKPDNVLLDTTRTEAKVADFGLSREWREDATMSAAGTPLFSAPEVLRRERYSSAADVWSYGCVISCLTTRTIHPFPPSASPYDLRRGVSEGALLPSAEGAFAEVVAQCTRPDVDERPSFAQLLALLESPQMAERVSLAEDSFARTVSSASRPSVRVACRSANAAAQLDGRLVVVDVVVTQ